MSSEIKDVPIGIKIIQRISDKFFPNRIFNRNLWYRSSVLVLTFLAYTTYHASRKPISVVKTILHRNCSGLTPPSYKLILDSNNDTWCDWAPFDGPNATQLLGTLDSSFLFAYGAAMFMSGLVAERVSLRYFLALGMIFSGIASYLLGIAHSYGIHSLQYFIIVQIFGGIVQTTGWPGVVAVMGNWFGKGKRGLIFGIWNSHTSIGNALGTFVAARFASSDWGLSFIVPGVIIATTGFIVFLFLVPNPADVNCVTPEQNRQEIRDKKNGKRSNEDRPILVNDDVPKAVGFFGALKIPGVIEFSLCLFFAKLVSYTFLYWLPQYITYSTTLSVEHSADLSTVFDFGGIAGGIAAGMISDYSGMSATTCSVMLFVAVPVMFIYNLYGATNIILNVALLIISGILVNGPYALITTAVSAELGTHRSLQGNSKALATVTSIIDGTGSIGAAVGPYLAGVVSQWGWGNVFYMLMLSDVLALLLLVRLVSREISQWRRSSREQPWEA
uniref:Sugar phosphate exchanger 3 n=1 Tax=Clastoptera arizonana TaxID=38151 RepID=A0A1B6D3H7_9HEMI